MNPEILHGTAQVKFSKPGTIINEFPESFYKGYPGDGLNKCFRQLTDNSYSSQDSNAFRNADNSCTLNFYKTTPNNIDLIRVSAAPGTTIKSFRTVYDRQVYQQRTIATRSDGVQVVMPQRTSAVNDGIRKVHTFGEFSSSFFDAVYITVFCPVLLYFHDGLTSSHMTD